MGIAINISQEPDILGQPMPPKTAIAMAMQNFLSTFAATGIMIKIKVILLAISSEELIRM